MIARLPESDPGPVPEVAHYFSGKFGMTIQTGTDCGSSERQFFDRRDRVSGAQFAIFDLFRVTTEFLSQPNRSRIHQMGTTDFDHIPEFLRFCFEPLL